MILPKPIIVCLMNLIFYEQQNITVEEKEPVSYVSLETVTMETREMFIFTQS